MMKIAFVIDTIESPTAGTEKQLLLLIKHLDRSRFKPYLCVLSSSDWLEKEFDLCPLHVIGMKVAKNMKTLLGILSFSRFLKKEQIAIVQTHFRDGNIAGILAGILAGTRIISTRRNQGYWLNQSEIKLQKLLNNWVDLFIANSQSTKNWAIQTEGISPERVQVIYNAIDLEPYKTITEQDGVNVRKELGIPLDVRVVGIVANLRPVKGIDVFLRAAAIVKKRLPDTWFVIVGDGEERQNAKILSKELGIKDNVYFAGRRTDIPRLLSAFDVGVLSSHSESFSNSVIEYLAAGLPVVATDVGGCREAIADGKTGFIVTVGNNQQLAQGIMDILKQNCFADRQGEIKQSALRLFSLQAMKEEYTNIYSPSHETTYKKTAVSF